MSVASAKPRRSAKAAESADIVAPRKPRVKVVASQAQRPRPAALSGFAALYLATPMERIHLIRQGVPANALVQTSEEMGVTKERMFTLLKFSRATVNRRIREEQALPSEFSERIIGLQRLVGQVEVMVAESGELAGFNAAHWVADWLERPLAALDNARPADFMDTIEGQELVSSLLAKMQSGAYA